MSVFAKPQHQQSFRKLCSKHKIHLAGKNFQECLIKLLESMDKEIDGLEKAVGSSKKAHTLGFGLHQGPKK